MKASDNRCIIITIQVKSVCHTFVTEVSSDKKMKVIESVEVRKLFFIANGE
jgi:hypothetical protein